MEGDRRLESESRSCSRGHKKHFLECRVVVEAFLSWTDKARAGDRAKAAKALGAAYVASSLPKDKQAGAYMAMSHLLDDPSPQVRLALAEALACSEDAPRPIIIALAEDQVEIAFPVIINSPVLRELDLVDLIGRGSSLTRALIAARADLTAGVCAAMAEIGSECEVLIMLENFSAQLTPSSLRRISQRFGEEPEIRSLLLDRSDLPADARHVLVRQVGEALESAGIVGHVITTARARQIIQEAADTAVTLIAGEASGQDRSYLVEHLRQQSQLTPAFEERRVRSILATGRNHAIKALYQSTGLSGRSLEVFTEATRLWRQAAEMPYGGAVQHVAKRLLDTFSNGADDATVYEMMSMIEKLLIVDQRQRARSFAQELMAEAA